jgi:hypothetical protein
MKMGDNTIRNLIVSWKWVIICLSKSDKWTKEKLGTNSGYSFENSGRTSEVKLLVRGAHSTKALSMCSSPYFILVKKCFA